MSRLVEAIPTMVVDMAVNGLTEVRDTAVMVGMGKMDTAEEATMIAAVMTVVTEVEVVMIDGKTIAVLEIWKEESAKTCL